MPTAIWSPATPPTTRASRLWRKVLDAHPEYVTDQTTGEDLMDMIKRYRRILSQLDEPFPEPFILQDVIDSYKRQTGEAPAAANEGGRQEAAEQAGGQEGGREESEDKQKAEDEKKAEGKKPGVEKLEGEEAAVVPAFLQSVTGVWPSADVE